MKQKIKLFIAIIIVALLTIIFFPKPYVKGGLGGFIGSGATAYREEYSCFGVKYSYHPAGCADCGNVYNCYGIAYGKKCYTESYSEGTTSKDITGCR